MKITSIKTDMTLTAIGASLTSLLYRGYELLAAPSPLFRIGLRDTDGKAVKLSAYDAKETEYNGDCVKFSGFPYDITVKLNLHGGDGISADISLENNGKFAVEWVVILPLNLKPLQDDGGANNTRLLLPYNEGALLNTVKYITKDEPEYPSYGHLMMFPNMLFTQFASYLFDADGEPNYLNIYTPDKKRGPKEITVRDGELIIKIFYGADRGQSVDIDFPLVITAGKGGWENSTEKYKKFFNDNPPPRLKRSDKNNRLPEWYDDDMLVVSYPVRGVHDMDDMKPNALFPYDNALPIIDEIAEKTGMRPLVLLMHWEGTAPWAPPYVMPPYDVNGSFYKFRDELHRRGYPLGVYCSGFGFTEKSNLCDYDNTERIAREGLLSAMCSGPDGKVLHSRICPGQRSGYDTCPACEKGKKLLGEAYTPLFSAGLDYAQILDQNHGGGQYLCYSENHGHPYTPGAWMTENMQDMLSDWNISAGKMLLGCESSSAEPFMADLLLNDNRYELCYYLGRPVPLYSYLYHEYIRNFMGNQVSCPLPKTTDALLYRIAYSFAIGDIPTVIITPEGDISPSWGTRDFSVKPDKEKVLSFLSVCSAAYKNRLKKVLSHGKMIQPPEIKCGIAPFGSELPELIISSWEYEDKKVTVIINPFEKDAEFEFDGKKMTAEKTSVLVFKG